MQFIRKWGMMDGRGCLWSSLCQSNMAVLPTHSANCSPFYPVLKEMSLGDTSTLPGDSQRRSCRNRMWGTETMKLAWGYILGPRACPMT